MLTYKINNLYNKILRFELELSESMEDLRGEYKNNKYYSIIYRNLISIKKQLIKLER